MSKSRILRWVVLILNLLGALAFTFLAGFATASYRASANSVYRELEQNHALVAKPAYATGEPLDVEARLRTIGRGGYYPILGCLGAVACLLNGAIFFLSHRPVREERTVKTVSADSP